MTLLDSIGVDVLRHRLEGVAQAMQGALLRSAHSPIVKEGMDASACLFDPQGQALAQSQSIPLHLGALIPAVAAILARFPVAGMADGDLYLLNDPFAGGTHLPDFTLLRPILLDGRPVALAASMLHHQDVGGLRPGSVPADAREIFHEGLRIPALKLGCEDRPEPALLRLLCLNSRTPAVMEGDLGAQIAAAVTAARAVREIAAEIGAAAFADGAARLLDRTEAAVRQVLRELPDGCYRGRDALDDDGVDSGVPVPVEVMVEVAGDRLVVDFAGSAAQVTGPVNSVRSGPLAAALYALLSLAPRGTPANGGALRALDLRLPERSVVNAAAPAAVNGRMATVRLCMSAILQAVAQASAGRMPAANAGMSLVLAFSGAWPDGRPFMFGEIVAGGAGGGPHADGAEAVSTDVGNAMNMPAEMLEAAAPLRVLDLGLREGSGGAGTWRGGLGIRRSYEALVDGIAVTHRGERFRSQPAGTAGGGAPAPARAWVTTAEGQERPLTSKCSLVLNRGDRLTVETCGGAGYGDPAARAADAAAADRAAGKAGQSGGRAG
ncbi:MAG: hydantoinase B/oxoprolinase family protein [Sneathiellaceae bacterium]